MSPRERSPRGSDTERDRPSILGDLSLGAQLSLRGGREVVLRTVLTAIGVGVATAALLLAASLPTILDNLAQRHADRMDYQVALYPEPPAGDDTLLVGLADTQYDGRDIHGRVVRAEGSNPPLPPGLAEIPGHGEIVLSPALADLLGDPEAKALLQGFGHHTVVGEIGPEGLMGPGELAFYLGSAGLSLENAGIRVTEYGGEPRAVLEGPVILLIGVVGVVVMLTPVVVFLGAAVRFGGEQRDRRLAALRLMGADRRATRRIAAGETLPGVALGLALGTGIFFLGRPIVESVSVSSGLFTADVTPQPLLALLVLVGVPMLSLWVVLGSMKGVVVDPLGTVRRAERPSPRLWWRLLLLVLGVVLIVLSMDFEMTRRLGLTGAAWLPLVSIGLLAVLFGTTAALPWLVERVFGRASGGPLSLQLALRRLGAAGGGPTRAVSGIIVTVAGAIALQSLFANAWAESTVVRAETRTQAYAEDEFGGSGFQIQADLMMPPADNDPVAAVSEVPGVEEAVAFSTVWGVADSGADVVVHVADCAALRQMADLPECSPGDAFSGVPGLAAGDTVTVRPKDERAESAWTVPRLTEFEGPLVEHPWHTWGHTARDVVLATPEAAVLPGEIATRSSVWIRVDPSVPEMEDELRFAVVALDPTSRVDFPMLSATYSAMINMRDALIAGALASLAVIAAGLVVGTVEQVRERRRVHAVLTAFGTRRSTLVASVLWQTTLPVLLGVALAATVGTALGLLVQRVAGIPLAFTPIDTLVIVGAGVGVAFLTTLLAIPALLRTMRPEGLRSE
ncbi:ABC transporter permease [Nocardiopsis sp. B62]|uniref:ABC transporter permease n=1 Tax=Nocardiopsis sp. B62 TaxID=2824874 RepID=UPI001B394ED3|nr:ABC transporter permease [Nocardiopsis sp. B62]MBQ1081887.1 ABC transporter permease [Nocardiopsis sp. B62]